jgi:cobalamin synthase
MRQSKKDLPAVRAISGNRMTMSMSAYLRKYALLSIVGILIGIIQTSAFGAIPFIKATPDLIFMFVFAVGFLDGMIPGAIAAVAGGFISDVLGSFGASALIFFYLVTVIASCLISQSRFATNFPTWIIISASACTLKAFYSVLLVSTLSFSYSIIDLFGNTVIPEFIYTFIFGIPIFFIVKKIVNSF